MRLSYLLTFLCATIATTQCDRLANGIILYGYNLHLNFTENSFTRPPYEYQGYLQLRFSLYNSYPGDVKMYAAHDFIRVNSAYIEINSTASDITSFEIDNSTDLLTLGGTSIASSTAYDSYLNIFYTSRLSVDDLYGLYKLSYTSNEQPRYMVATQFLPSFARRVFPCMDELTFKTSLRLNITHPSNMAAYFNTPIDSSINATDPDDSYVTTYFRTTGDMETYMAGFAIVPSIDFTCSAGDNSTTNIDYYQVCSKPETEPYRKWALEVGPSLLSELNNYTNYRYGAGMGFPKMDFVAIPDMVDGSTENFGLITFREQNLLYDEDNSSNLEKQNVVQAIAFELAQMWFGNFASPEWWNYSYFTKGIAYYFQYFITDRVIADWEMDKQFVFRVFQPSLELDSLMSSQNLRSESVNTTQEIISSLGMITHLKGASLYRMLKDVIATYKYFQKGVEYFLTSFSKRNSEPQGMWNLISAQINVNNRNLLPKDEVLKDVLIDWEVNPGFPLLEVTKTGPATINVAQKGRFLYTTLDTRYEWYVPISYAYASNISDFGNTTLNQWLLPNSSVEVELPNQDEEWVILNKQAAGYYRVHYGDMWQNITSAVHQSEFSGIPELNRAQLLDDIFALARASIVNYTVAFDLVDYLSEEDSLYPWMSAKNGANYILRRVGYSTSLGLKVEALFLNLIKKIYESVPWSTVDENNHFYSIKQIEILSAACKLGYLDCVRNAVRQFQTFMSTGTRPDKNLRTVVYCTGFLYNGATTDWDVLWQAYQTTELATEKVKLLSALGCTENKELLEKSLKLTLNETSGIQSQDASIIFTSVYSNSKGGADAALNFLIANHKAIVARYQDMNGISNMLLGLAEHLTETSQITQLRNFLLNTSDLPEEFKIVADRALEITDVNVIWLDRHLDELNTYFQIG